MVISPGIINAHSPVILVAAITSRKTSRVYPFEALIEPPEGGLSVRSKVMLTHLRSIDQRRVVGAYGRVGATTMDLVEEALRIATGLTEV